MRVLIGCEESGIVRRAFAARGHEAWSCDLQAAADGSNMHIIGDVRDQLHKGWDLLALFHPPCKRLCNSGVRWLTDPPTKLGPEYPAAVRIEYSGWGREDRLAFMWHQLADGADLFSQCWNAPIERIACENPVMHRHAKALIENYQPPAQFVQPHWFGDPAFKATGLYLKNLPPLVRTNPLTPPKPGTDDHKAWSVIHRASEHPDRSKMRSRTFPGMADACADQWGGEIRMAA